MFTSTSHLTLTFAILQCLQWSINAVLANSPGEITPERVDLEIGGSANITCSMNLQIFRGKNSQSLYFVEEDTNRQVPQTDIAIINETTIVYMLRNATKQDRNYYCKSGRRGVAASHISVGSKPFDIVDFKCRGYDYLYMACNFTIPENTIPTKYNLSFSAHSVNYLQKCELEIHNTHAICNLTLEKGNYRPNYDLYNFTLIGDNVIGNKLQNFKVIHEESIIPPRPDIQIQQITTKSALLTWHMSRYSYYAKGLQYEVRLQAKNMNWSLYTDLEIRNNKSEYSILLKNLPHAYYTYTISVRLRIHSRRAEWGVPYNGEFRTLAKAPDAAPKTDVGSFYIDSTETRVRLYWQQLPVYEHNGPNFHYVVTQVERDNVVVDIQPLEIDQTSATFPWDRQHHYRFTIKSRNDIGDSADASHINIHAMPKLIDNQSPKWIRNIYHAPNRTYTLSWNAPTYNVAELVDYTVFWCQSKRAIPNDCKDSLQSQHISKATTRFTTAPQEQEHTLNLAVSANYVNYSTGMHWTMCTADVSSDLVKLEPEIHAISAHAIEIQWSTDRICTSLLEGYNLTYCRVASPIVASLAQSTDIMQMQPCLEGTSNTIIVEKTAKKYLLDNLKAYSIYKIEMFMFSKQKVGRASDVQYTRTLEGAPSKPRILQYFNVTSNSVWLSWLPPSDLNGNLRYYIIVQNNEHHILNCTHDVNNTCNLDSNEEIHFKLETLSSYTDYKIYIIAHTVNSSPPSNDVHFRTLVGIPSNPHHIEVPVVGKRKILQWSRPDVASGRVEFYEVAVTVWYKNEKERQRISGIVNATSCNIIIPTCLDPNYEHTVQIRAVNVAARANEVEQHSVAAASTTIKADYVATDDIDAQYYFGNDDLKCIGTQLSEEAEQKALANYRNQKVYVQYKSVWERGPMFGCAATAELAEKTLLPSCVLVLIIVLCISSYCARKKYNKMSDIECAVPAGLQNAYPTKANGIDNHIIEGDDDDDDYKRSKESLFNTEAKHLLASVSNDSGYMCGETVACMADGNGGGITPSSLGKSSGYAGSDHEYTPHEMFEAKQKELQLKQKQQQQQEKEQVRPDISDDYMPMEILNQNAVIPVDSNLSQKHTKDGYINPNEVFKHKPPNGLTIMSNESVYIKPNKASSWQPPTVTNSQNAVLPTISGGCGVPTVGGNDYVSQQMLSKTIMPPTHNGYTTLESLRKTSVLNMPTTVATTAQQQPNHHFHGGGRLPPISGYVTQKELSAFGQQNLS